MSEEKGFDLDTLFVDQKKSEVGAWETFYGSSELLIGSTEGKKYKSLLAKLYKKNRLSLDDTNEEYVELIQELTAEALATEVLYNWKNINLGGQKNVPYTKELGKLALMSSAKLMNFVNEKANDPSRFPLDAKEEPAETEKTAPAAPTLTSVS